MPSGKRVLLTAMWPSTRPSFMDQQSSTTDCKYKQCIVHRSGLTVDVVVPYVLQASVDQLFGRRKEFALVNVAGKRVPGVPAESWEFALAKLAPLGRLSAICDETYRVTIGHNIAACASNERASNQSGLFPASNGHYDVSYFT